MDKHRPVKELPEDIKQLPHEETVCRFCGVSYLVHHEIAKLEDKVEQLQEEVDRLKHIETEKVSWNFEKSKLEEALKRTREEQSVLQSTLKDKEAELKQSISQYDTLKQEKDRQEMETQSMRCLVREHLDRFKKDVDQLSQYRVKVHQLLIEESLSMSQLKEKCLVRCLSFEEQSGKVHLQLTSEIKKLQEELKCRRKEEVELKQSLKERRDSCQRYRAHNQELLQNVENWKNEFASKDEKVTSLTKELRLFKFEAQDLKMKLKASIEENECVLRRTNALEAELEDIEANKNSVQRALEKARQELKTFEQNFVTEEKALRSSLENCQQKLAKSQETTRLLHLEYSQQLKAIKKEQVSALENLRNTLMEDHKKVLQDATVNNLTTLRDMQAKSTQMKSSLAATELEKTRLVSSLTEQLRREKDIADRELTEHLNTVKALELSLLQEKRTRKEIEDNFSTRSDEIQRTMESLESAERMKKDLEDRLTGAYREISTLQAIIERECEEREKLTEELAKVKAITKNTPHRKSGQYGKR